MKKLLPILFLLLALQVKAQTGAFVTHSIQLDERSATWRNGIGVERYLKHKPLFYSVSINRISFSDQSRPGTSMPVANLHTDSTFTLLEQSAFLTKHDLRVSLVRTFPIRDLTFTAGIEGILGHTEVSRSVDYATYWNQNGTYMAGEVMGFQGPHAYQNERYTTRQHYLKWGAAPVVGLMLAPGPHWVMQMNLKAQWVRREFLNETHEDLGAVDPIYRGLQRWDSAVLLEWKLGYRFGKKE